jgi:hypothetical protein
MVDGRFAQTPQPSSFLAGRKPAFLLAVNATIDPALAVTPSRSSACFRISCGPHQRGSLWNEF